MIKIGKKTDLLLEGIVTYEAISTGLFVIKLDTKIEGFPEEFLVHNMSGSYVMVRPND